MVQLQRTGTLSAPCPFVACAANVSNRFGEQEAGDQKSTGCGMSPNRIRVIASEQTHGWPTCSKGTTATKQSCHRNVRREADSARTDGLWAISVPLMRQLFRDPDCAASRCRMARTSAKRSKRSRDRTRVKIHAHAHCEEDDPRHGVLHDGSGETTPASVSLGEGQPTNEGHRHDDPAPVHQMCERKDRRVHDQRKTIVLEQCPVAAEEQRPENNLRMRRSRPIQISLAVGNEGAWG